jgi:transposase-like protein
MGRPTKLTLELQENICKALSKGLPITTACDAVGISTQSYYTWVNQAEDDSFQDDSKESLIAFSDAVKKAQADCEERLLEIIENATISAKNWMAAAWILDRTRPDKYGQKTRTDLTVRDPIEIVIRGVPNKEEGDAKGTGEEGLPEEVHGGAQGSNTQEV